MRSSLSKTGETTRPAAMAPRRSPLTLPLNSTVRHRPAVARHHRHGHRLAADVETNSRSGRRVTDFGYLCSVDVTPVT
ncbi:hypothetical protein, partial [Actinoplanes sp. NPDC049802]|uniref:hypothetical protein n=1 Tax=Actinoplanes sp. NPDC049802 TaxID=3154742 RepID=UPI0033F7B682